MKVCGGRASARLCRSYSFAPLGLSHLPLAPRLAPWAAFLRRFAADDGDPVSLFERPVVVLPPKQEQAYIFKSDFRVEESLVARSPSHAPRF